MYDLQLYKNLKNQILDSCTVKGHTRVLGGEPGNRANMYMHVVTTAIAAVALKMRPKLMKANTTVGYMYMYQAV